MARASTGRYPYEEGDTIVIGPECFASKDGEVLSWRGVNYVKQYVPPTIPEPPRFNFEQTDDDRL